MGCKLCQPEKDDKPKKYRPNLIDKYVQGVAIIDIHQISKEDSLSYILDQNELQKSIIQSFCRKQEEKCIQKFPDLDQSQFVFTHFKLKKSDYPYLAIFEMKLKARACEQLFPQCSFEEKYDIFDLPKKYGQINIITSYWIPKKCEILEKIGENVNKSHKRERDSLESEATNQSQSQTNNKLGQNQHSKIPSDDPVLEEYDQYEQNNEKQNLEISQEYFEKNYKYILKISQGCFGVVSLHYDARKQKLFAVKLLKNKQYNKGSEDECEVEDELAEEREEELRRVLKAIRGVDLPPEERFNDKQNEEIQGLNRNIVREIMITHNRKQSDKINNLEGVVYFEKEQNFILIFDYFGGCEFQQEQPTCDLFRYIETNKINLFQPMKPKQKVKFVKNIMTQILKAVSHLYSEDNISKNKKNNNNNVSNLGRPKILLRDLNLANILIRRIFSPIPKKSRFEILLIDFGMAKQQTINNNCSQLKGLLMQTPTSFCKMQNSSIDSGDLIDAASEESKFLVNNLAKKKCQKSTKSIFKHHKTSIAIQACSPGRFPKYLFDEYQTYNQANDIFAISALYFSLYKQLSIKMDEDFQNTIEWMSGMTFEIYTKYQYVMNNYVSEQCFDRARALFQNGLSTTLQYESKIPGFAEILTKFSVEDMAGQKSCVTLESLTI